MSRLRPTGRFGRRKRVTAVRRRSNQGRAVGSESFPSGTRKPKVWVRVVAFAAVLATAWHIFASFLWIAPPSPLREVVPGNALSSYMLPMFGQSWSVFAPEPINGDFHFNVRAKVLGDDGELRETGWVSATDVELSMIRYNLTPPRGGLQSSEVASSYKTAYDKLEQVQRTTVGGDFAVDEWLVGLEAALENQAEAATQNADADEEPVEVNTAEIAQLVAEERRAAAYATQVARAIWGAEVEEVQYRVSRQNVVPFADRHNVNAERPEPSVILPGWRGPVVEEGQDDGNFAATFRKQYERNAE